MASSAGAVPTCEEKERLHRIYRFATSDYNRAFAFLDQRRGVLSKEDYFRLRQRS